MKKPVFTFLLLIIALAAILEACTKSTISQTTSTSGTQAPKTRPREAWVVRSVLDLKPRMLSIALHNNLWIAYNTQTAGFYKAWTGGINFDGPVYTSAHGPQPTTKGMAYLQEPDQNPWKIIQNGKELTPEVTYKGHTISNGQVSLKYELNYQGKKIKLEEKPEFFALEGQQVGLERTFTTAGIPAGTQVALALNLNSILADTDYKTNGKFAVTSQSTETVESKSFLVRAGTLTLNNNGKTTLALNLTPKPEPVKNTVDKLKQEEIIAGLFAKSDCNTCHNRDVKSVGPAYKAIA